eukprot:TRINITY_DN3532_c0_g1_i1.p1 TRINITY_DN3532_c0_g1~~TRINITY_DN3532_c0_g1_i1.p1  ORF type:complete len:803 (-),score=344.57 TRINITY_DN3532_c0_g1_i1:34-2442(-)
MESATSPAPKVVPFVLEMGAIEAKLAFVEKLKDRIEKMIQSALKQMEENPPSPPPVTRPSASTFVTATPSNTPVMFPHRQTFASPSAPTPNFSQIKGSSLRERSKTDPKERMRFLGDCKESIVKLEEELFRKKKQLEQFPNQTGTQDDTITLLLEEISNQSQRLRYFSLNPEVGRKDTIVSKERQGGSGLILGESRVHSQTKMEDSEKFKIQSSISNDQNVQKSNSTIDLNNSDSSPSYPPPLIPPSLSVVASTPQSSSSEFNNKGLNQLSDEERRVFRSSSRSRSFQEGSLLSKEEKTLNVEKERDLRGGWTAGSIIQETKDKKISLKFLLENYDAAVLRSVIIDVVGEDVELKNRFISSLEKQKTMNHSPRGKNKALTDENEENPHENRGFFPRHHKRTPSTNLEAKTKAPPSVNLVMGGVYQGYLNVQMKNKWKKRYLITTPDNLYIFKSTESEKPPKTVSLHLASIRMTDEIKKLQFILFTPSAQWKFRAENEREMLNWTATLDDLCNAIVLKSIGTEKIGGPNGGKDNQGSKNPQSPTSPENLPAQTTEKKELLELLRLNGNSKCADCGKADPEWVSINLGVFVCIECSGTHRNLGTHISKVRSIQYDHIEAENLLKLKELGNVKANEFWEANLAASSHSKPGERENINSKAEYIKRKYLDLEFTREEDKPAILASREEGNPNPTLHHIANLKKNPASSSNPSLGQSREEIQTKFIKSGFRKSTGVLFEKDAHKEKEKEKEKEMRKERKAQEKEEKKERKEQERKEKEEKKGHHKDYRAEFSKVVSGLSKNWDEDKK